MVYSPFVLSVGMFCLTGISLLKLEWITNSFSINFNKAGFQRLKNWRQYPQFTILSLFFFIVLIGTWNIEDTGYFMERLRIKVPFLVLPLTFILLPPFSKRQLNGLLYFMIIMLTITSIGILINYFLHFEVINENIKMGQPMPTPRNHIRYSLMMALGVIAGIHLIVEKFKARFDIEKQVIMAITIFLFLFIHVLAVKSGIFILYIALIAYFFRFILFSRHYLWAIGGLALLITLPVFAFFYVPSFRAKVGYTRHDFYMFSKGETKNYGDSGRIISIQVGLEIFQEHPILGVGAGNLRKEVNQKFQSESIEYHEVLMPHNQFLFVSAGTGILGLIIFLGTFLFPAVYHKNYQNPLFFTFYILIAAVFMIEHTIENAIGVAYYLFFLLLFLRSNEPLADNTKKLSV